MLRVFYGESATLSQDHPPVASVPLSLTTLPATRLYPSAMHRGNPALQRPRNSSERLLDFSEFSVNEWHSKARASLEKVENRTMSYGSLYAHRKQHKLYVGPT